MNRYEGDPKLIVDPDGWDMQCKGGQPIMDQGLENMVTLTLALNGDWFGNAFLSNAEKIGSDVKRKASGAITLSKLNDIRQAVDKALDSDVYGEKDITVINLQSYNVTIYAKIKPPGADVQELIIQQNGQNWVNQIIDPAYRRIT